MSQSPNYIADRSLRVLIADDSSFMRTALRKIIEADPLLKVVGEARDGREAVDLAATCRPHVITMDVEMPGMDGIAAAKAIVDAHGPAINIIIVSGGDRFGADGTVEALKCGAADFVSKSSSFVDLDLGRLTQELCPKVRFWALSALEKGALGGRRLRQAAQAEPTLVRSAQAVGGPMDLIVVGVSTGGPATLPPLLRAMGSIRVPVVIAQHMPPEFTKSLAENLSHDLGRPVIEASIGQDVEPGMLVVLPGGRDTAVRRSSHAANAFTVSAAASSSTVHPCVDTLFQAAATVARQPVAVVLTGMGADGTHGSAQFHQKGFRVLVQEPATAIVPGMPLSAIEAGHATHVLPVDEIGTRLARWAARDITQTTEQREVR